MLVQMGEMFETGIKRRAFDLGGGKPEKYTLIKS